MADEIIVDLHYRAQTLIPHHLSISTPGVRGGGGGLAPRVATRETRRNSCDHIPA